MNSGYVVLWLMWSVVASIVFVLCWIGVANRKNLFVYFGTAFLGAAIVYPAIYLTHAILKIMEPFG